jgi:hypothetical protein
MISSNDTRSAPHVPLTLSHHSEDYQKGYLDGYRAGFEDKKRSGTYDLSMKYLYIVVAIAIAILLIKII